MVQGLAHRPEPGQALSVTADIGGTIGGTGERGPHPPPGHNIAGSLAFLSKKLLISTTTTSKF